MTNPDAHLNAARRRPSPTRCGLGYVFISAVFMVVSLAGLTMGTSAASAAPMCFDESGEVTTPPLDLASTCDTASLDTASLDTVSLDTASFDTVGLDTASLDTVVQSTTNSTATTIVGWTVFTVLVGLILLSLATGRELPEQARL